MYVVFGASGNVGQQTIRRLREAGCPVRAVVRHAKQREPFTRLGCDIAIADLMDRASVVEAIEGADAVQILCPVPQHAPDPADTMLQMIETAASALRANPPPRILALSDYGAELEGNTGITSLFHALETQLKPVPSHLTLLRAAEHMHNWARVMPGALAAGVLPSLHHPLDKRFPTVAAQDVGRLAADLLMDHDPEGEMSPRVVSVEGPQRVSVLDVARTISTLGGRAIAARALPREAWTPTLLGAGMSASHAQLVADLYDAHNAGRIDVEAGMGERRFGSTELAEVLEGLVRGVEVAR